MQTTVYTQMTTSQIVKRVLASQTLSSCWCGQTGWLRNTSNLTDVYSSVQMKFEAQQRGEMTLLHFKLVIAKEKSILGDCGAVLKIPSSGVHCQNLNDLLEVLLIMNNQEITYIWLSFLFVVLLSCYYYQHLRRYRREVEVNKPVHKWLKKNEFTVVRNVWWSWS